MKVLAPGIIGDHRPRAALDQELPEAVAIVGGIGGAQTAWRQRFEQAEGDQRVATLTGTDVESDGTAATIDNSMDFCRSPATRAAVDQLHAARLGRHQRGKQLPPDAAPRPATKRL